MTKIYFNKPYDDSYAILASHLVSVLSVNSIKNILKDNMFIKSMINSEVKQLDISGHFLDCIDGELIKNKKLREKNKCLNTVGDFYFSELDLPRLREEIRKFSKEMGINLES